MSYTELEFDEATVAGIPRLVFLLEEAGGVPAMVGDADRTVVDRFRQRLRDAGLVVRTFTSDAGLELEVFHALLDTVDPHIPPPPRELPPDVYPFTGRSAELDALDSLLAEGRESSVMMILAVSGMAGVGKTALAVHWAHRVAGRFPDGQLYVDLRGYDPDQPMPAGNALATFLRALRVNDAEIPYDLGERAARYRTLVADRRMLVVLDNASSVEQVRLLLPGTPSCVVMVTSRDSLGGLVARYGARRIDLEVLSMHDAVGLLRMQVGERVEVDPEAAVTLATQCVRLPLALRVAAELAANRPAIPLALLVNELADQQQRLDLMDAGGDPRTAVGAVFSWSYRHLPDDAARMFRLVGLHPGADFDLYAAAALTHTALEQAQRLLDLLARAHLIDSPGAGRYGMHDLLRAYAARLAGTYDTAEDRRAALTRLFDYYLATAAQATDTMYPADQHHRPCILPTPTPTPLVTDPTAALAWLDAEHLNLVATCAQAAAQGWYGHTIALAAILFGGFYDAGRNHENLSVQTYARHAADHSGDRVAETQALIRIGNIHWALGHYALAAQHLQQALALVRKSRDQVGEARIYSHLGVIHWRQGSYEPAVVHQRQAQTLFHEVKDRRGEGYTLVYLGLVYERQGRYKQAAVQHRQALTLFCQVGNRSGEAFALGALGSVYQQQGRYNQAADHLTQ
ncbi:MAG TPA: tetratricopeptide repeat protein, partial [Pseudonocardiaceae bacterium]|nr:tetratricopeptide repeat protein [Pseudonocardiaceae bacterium]